MKTVKLVPALCKAEGSEWTGYVVMRPLNFDEKYDYLEAIGVEVKEDGSVEGSKTNLMQKSRNMVRMSEKHYVEVSLVNMVTGEEVKSFDDMKQCSDMFDTLIEMAMKLMTGLKVGNG